MSSADGKELQRDTKKGKLAGVCAGLANYFGMETWLVRIIVVSSVLLGLGWFSIVGYIAAWFILDKRTSSKPKKKKDIADVESEKYVNKYCYESIKVKNKVWQKGEPPKQAFHDLQSTFSQLENQLQLMEKYVTSSKYTVEREINKL